MKFSIVIVALLAVFATSEAKDKRCGALITAQCEGIGQYEKCPSNPICDRHQVLEKNDAGCCCHKKCGKNEIWGSGCPEKTCEFDGEIYCIIAQNQCYCAEGYIRETQGGRCIKKEECPKKTCPNPNEIFSCACADSVCNQPDKICIQCLDGCYCEPGYVRDVEGGKCIPVNQCPKPTCSGAHENYRCECADKICNQPDKICKRCLDGCYCEPGFVRDVEGGVCVPAEQCTPITIPPPTCSNPNESFYCKCADSVCNQPDKVCIQCLDGCYCNEGYIRETEGGVCIKKEECSEIKPCIDPNEEWRCDFRDIQCLLAEIANPNANTRRAGINPCHWGCFCADGYARSLDGTCKLNEPSPCVDGIGITPPTETDV